MPGKFSSSSASAYDRAIAFGLLLVLVALLLHDALAITGRTGTTRVTTVSLPLPKGKATSSSSRAHARPGHGRPVSSFMQEAMSASRRAALREQARRAAKNHAMAAADAPPTAATAPVTAAAPATTTAPSVTREGMLQRASHHPPSLAPQSMKPQQRPPPLRPTPPPRDIAQRTSIRIQAEPGGGQGIDGASCSDGSDPYNPTDSLGAGCPSCAGTDDGVSCLYCQETTQCGTCDMQGVIDHCTQAGTALLTIDDGPFNTTGQVLDILASLGVKAAFFNRGDHAAQFPQFVARMYAEGHFVAQHSYDHPNFNCLTDAQRTEQLTLAQQALTNATNGAWTPTHFRPPFGALNTASKASVDAMNLKSVMWLLDTEDYNANVTNTQNIVNGYMTGFDPATNSWITLMHCDTDVGISLVSWIVNRVRSRGYTFITAPQCFDTSLDPYTYFTPITNTPECRTLPHSCVYDQCGTNTTCCDPLNCCSTTGECGVGDAYCGAGVCVAGACSSCQWRPEGPNTNVPPPTSTAGMAPPPGGSTGGGGGTGGNANGGTGSVSVPGQDVSAATTTSSPVARFTSLSLTTLVVFVTASLVVH